MKAVGEDGFTLVEMLVSLALLAVAGVLLAEGFASGRGVWARVEAHTTAGQDVSAAQRLLRASLEQLYPATRYESATPVIDLDGAPDRLDFLSAASGPGSAGEVRRRRLELTPAGELELSSSGMQASSPSAEARILLRHVAGLELSYFGAGSPDGTRAWRSRWAHTSSPPELVRARVDFAPGDRRSWPELIVQPGAMVDSQCMLDPASGGCRGRQ